MIFLTPRQDPIIRWTPQLTNEPDSRSFQRDFGITSIDCKNQSRFFHRTTFRRLDRIRASSASEECCRRLAVAVALYRSAFYALRKQLPSGLAVYVVTKSFIEKRTALHGVVALDVNISLVQGETCIT